MKILLKTSVAAVALLTGAGLAMAQDSGAASATGGMGGDITCAHIVELDTQEAERALYFLAGRQVAQGETGVGTDTTAATGTDTGAATDTTAGAAGTDTGMDTGTTTSAEAGTEMETDTDTTAGAATGMDTDTTASADDTSTDMETDTDTTAGATTSTDSDTMAADDTGADMGTDTTTTAGTGAAGGASDTLAIVGYFEIPVESVMTACENAPESRVSDVLRDESGGAMQ